jgi:hypothetical protein
MVAQVVLVLLDMALVQEFLVKVMLVVHLLVAQIIYRQVVAELGQWVETQIIPTVVMVVQDIQLLSQDLQPHMLVVAVDQEMGELRVLAAQEVAVTEL